jgi:putative ABC transport system permease protein
MNDILQDIKYGIRTLLFRHSGPTIVAVIVLALGIGGSSAIFSVANAALLRPLPFENPDRLAILWEVQQGTTVVPFAGANYVDVREQSQAFEQMALLVFPNLNVTDGAEPERVSAGACSPELFSLLGVKLAAGRAFTAEEAQPGKNRVAILSPGYLKRHYASDPGVVGKEININGFPMTIIGILPNDFTFPLQAEEPEIWIPLPLDSRVLGNRETHYLRVLAMLKPDATLERANEELRGIAAQLETLYPRTNTERGMKALPLQQQVVGEIRPALLMLFGAVGLVLLIACANVANLLLARASSRQKEMALRSALGASRARIIRQLLTESLLLSLMGGAGGLLLAVWGVKVLVALNTQYIPRIVKVDIDGWVLGFTLIVSALTGIIFGLAPALQASKVDLNNSLKEGSGRTTAGMFSRRTRGLLVIAEVALSVILLIAAGLIIRSFLRLQEINPGFQTQRVLTMEVNLPGNKYREGPQIQNFYEQVVDKLAALPGVESVSVINNLPLGGDTTTAYLIEGHPDPRNQEDQMTAYRIISPDYFHTMNIPLLKGRYFTAQDTKRDVGVAIINQALADRDLPGEEPIGKRLVIDYGQKIPREIVGVVGNVKHYGLDAAVKPETYVPLPEDPWRTMNLAVRTTSDPLALARAVRSSFLSVDKDLPVYDIKTMDQRVEASFSQRRSQVFLLSIFAIVAFVMAIVGVYSVISYSVNQRRQEIGIRMALGAQQIDIFKLVVGQGLLLGIIGLVVGLLGALAFNRLIASLLYGITVTDPIVFLIVPVVLMLATLVASYLPARRASRVDPTIALRYE